MRFLLSIHCKTNSDGLSRNRIYILKTCSTLHNLSIFVHLLPPVRVYVLRKGLQSLVSSSGLSQPKHNKRPKWEELTEEVVGGWRVRSPRFRFLIYYFICRFVITEYLLSAIRTSTNFKLKSFRNGCVEKPTDFARSKCRSWSRKRRSLQSIFRNSKRSWRSK